MPKHTIESDSTFAMSKDDILGYATPFPSQRGVLDVLASQHATVEAIEAKAAEMQRGADRARVWGKRCTRALLLPVILMALTGILLYQDKALFALYAMLAILVTVCVFTNTARHLEWKERYCKSILDSLQPIAGTDMCREALSYLESGVPGAVTWRDVALAERGQLYKFDVSIMRRLQLKEQHRIARERKGQVKTSVSAAVQVRGPFKYAISN